MRDIYKTAKQAQMAPVRGRVNAMMAQPRAVSQARKVARQTTGFQKGGHVKKVSHDSELTKWFLEQHGGTKKKKPHSTQEGRIAAGKRALFRGVKEKEKRQQMGPQAPARRKEAGMNVKKGGVMEKRKTYKLAHKLKNKDRLTQRDVERAEKLTKSFGKDEIRQAYGQATKSVQALLDQLLKKGKKSARPHGRDPVERQDPVGKKKGGKVDKKWIQKAVNPKHKGYCTPMTKKTCTPARKRLAKLFKSKARTGWKKANGGTVVMPTVGNDVRTRAYKQGALIHPRPRPTTLAHGRMRGVGIAKRGW